MKPVPIIGCALFAITSAFAQPGNGPVSKDLLAPPKITPPSPHAATFTKYGDIPVSPYSGVPNISIPLHDIRVRDIRVPVTLTYHASGVKVAEEAGRVGLGWALNCGGSISRTIIGRDDFLVAPAGYHNPLTNPIDIARLHFPRGPQFEPEDNSQAATSLLFRQSEPRDLRPYTSGAGEDFDMEPDVYNYNFNGRSGRFVLDRNRNVLIGKQEKLKIQVLDAGTVRGGSIKITDENGFVYLFNDYETVTVNGEAGGPGISTWYMSKISSPIGEEVNFYYQVVNGTNDLVGSLGSYYEMNSTFVSGCPGFSGFFQNQDPIADPVAKKMYSTVALERVEWEGGKIKFNYAADRQDIERERRVTNMEVFKSKTDTQPYEEVIFGYSYFQSNQGPNSPFEFSVSNYGHAAKRLKLVSLTRRALPVLPSHQEERHTFSYYEGIPLPPKNSFARDHWGYYNGKTGNTSFIPNYTLPPGPIAPSEFVGAMGPQRDPSELHMSAFSLKTITYPTKGSTTFYYQAHTYGVSETVALDPSTPPEPYKTTTSLMYDASPGAKGNVQNILLDMSDEYVTSEGRVFSTELKIAFRTSGKCKDMEGTPPNVWFELWPEIGGGNYFMRVSMGGDNCGTNNDLDCLFCDRSEYSSMNVFTTSRFVTLPRGRYHWRAFIPASEDRIVDLTTQASWWVDPALQPQEDLYETDRKYRVAGGLRIGRIEDFDNESGKLVNVKKYDYHLTTDADEDGVDEVYSYGRRMIQPQYTFFDLNFQAVPGQDNCLECIYMVRISDSSMPLANADGISIGYDKVREIFGESGEFGYTEYEYENEEDNIKYFYSPHTNKFIWLKPPAVSTSSKPTNGLLKSETKFNNEGVPVKRVENEYSEHNNQDVIYGVDIRKLGVTPGMAIAEINYILLPYPAIRSFFIYQSKSHEISYDADGAETARVTTEYFYENWNHLQMTKKVTGESNEHTVTTIMKYPLDYPEEQRSGSLMKLIEDHKHSAPVETSVIDVGPEENAEPVLMKRNITEYALFNTQLLPSAQVVYESGLPKSPTEVTPYIPTVPIFPDPLYKKALTLEYDNHLNLSRSQKYSDMSMSYLWGYNNRLVIAEVKNALPSEIFHISFEENGTTGAAKTGNKFLNASSYTFPSSFVPSSNTLMSYWYYDDRWRYSGPQPFSNTVNAPAGTLRIDEVRAYPKGSQMTTFTHDTAYGITSSTDLNGRTTYYEYDERGRLAVVRDDQGKITKSYTYRFKR
jgi:YD repeat-containing protein